MNQNKLSFESENFQIHYLTLNLQFNDLKQIKKIADYFSNTFDCNSVFIDCKNSTQNCTLVKKERSLSKAEFRVNSQKYWYGTSLSFSGNQSTYFYKTIREKGLDWEILNFDNTSLSRIDLCYDRKFKQSDCVQTLDSFLKNSCAKINFKVDNPKAEVVKGVFRVGKRSSPNYFRVYPKSNGKFIRFELELKQSAIKKFQSYLFLHQFEKWEELLTCHFYKEAMNKLDLDSPYTDWLIENSRKIRSVEMSENWLLTTYVQNICIVFFYINDLNSNNFSDGKMLKINFKNNSVH